MADPTPFEVNAAEVHVAAKLIAVACAMSGADLLKQEIVQLSGPGMMPPQDWTIVAFRTGTLEGKVRDILESHDSYCTDEADDRANLAKAIASELLS